MYACIYVSACMYVCMYMYVCYQVGVHFAFTHTHTYIYMYECVSWRLVSGVGGLVGRGWWFVMILRTFKTQFRLSLSKTKAGSGNFRLLKLAVHYTELGKKKKRNNLLTKHILLTQWEFQYSANNSTAVCTTWNSPRKHYNKIILNVLLPTCAMTETEFTCD